MRVHAYLPLTDVNGPGRRRLLHVQGCTLGCRGCWNPDTHAMDRGFEMTPLQIAASVAGSAKLGEITGLTVSGGEPLHQIGELLETVRLAHRKYPALSVGLYSGYTERELVNGEYMAVGEPPFTRFQKATLWRDLRRHLDFAVLGRYNEGLPAPPTTPLVTSKNQRLVLLTSRYTLADFSPQQVEFQIHADGLVQVTGFPRS
jgi:anaerobic ribonucleoside-triphosphate reductase activating protein